MLSIGQTNQSQQIAGRRRTLGIEEEIAEGRNIRP